MKCVQAWMYEKVIPSPFTDSQSLSTWKYYKSQAAIKWNGINTSEEFRCNKERLGLKLRNFNFIILGAWLHSTNYIKFSVIHKHTTPAGLHNESMTYHIQDICTRWQTLNWKKQKAKPIWQGWAPNSRVLFQNF